ncbi:14637_t:CDS:2, partial [Funneliformis caledonium]
DDDFKKVCKDIVFKKPVDGIIYKINSTQVADFVLPEECIKKFGDYLRTTVEIFSIVWANDGATYFLIAKIFHKDDKVQANS